MPQLLREEPALPEHAPLADDALIVSWLSISIGTSIIRDVALPLLVLAARGIWAGACV
jgi:hypothetical protein